MALGYIMIDTSNALKIDGWMFDDELEWLAQQAQKHQNILEIGSWKGRSTRALGDNTPGRVWAVDYWLEHDCEMRQFLENLSDLIIAERVIVMRTTSNNVTTMLHNTHRSFFDMIFLDGDHCYESVKSDISNCIPLLSPGGILCGHDYSVAWEGVMRAVEEILPNFYLHNTIWYKEIK